MKNKFSQTNTILLDKIIFCMTKIITVIDIGLYFKKKKSVPRQHFTSETIH